MAKLTALVFHLDGENGKEILTQLAYQQGGMLLCHSGKLTFTNDTRQNEMCEGDMLIIGPFTNFTFTYISPDFKGTLCKVDLEFVFSALPPITLGNNIHFINMHPLSHLSVADMEALVTLLSLLEHRGQYVEEHPLSNFFNNHLIHALAYLVLDSCLNINQTETKSSETKDSIMLTFHANLSRDFLNHRKVSYYAGLQNLTPRYFSTTIKAISGFSPLYWINKVVVAEAKRLMCNTKMSIKEISYSLNFVSPTFFARWFRECTGETPSKFRARCRITLVNKS